MLEEWLSYYKNMQTSQSDTIEISPELHFELQENELNYLNNKNKKNMNKNSINENSDDRVINLMMGDHFDNDDEDDDEDDEENDEDQTNL